MKNKGLSLVEVMIATAILGIVALMVIGLQLHMSSNTVRIREKMFATEKAMQMMEELRSLVLGSERTNIEVLDDYTENLSSGSANYVLTTDRSVTDPAHPNSGNMSIGGVWKYFRQVTVAPLPEEAHARKVEVKVYENSRTSPGTATKVLAETTSILRTIANEFVPTQVMDIYLIAIENVPGWWSDLATMVPTFDMVLQDIQMRNQGLEIRPHWIIRSAFGRDPFYMPYINSTTPTNAAAIPQVYFYPGMSSENNTVGGPAQLFYDPSRIRGNINVQGTLVSGGYPLADKYNHAVRYPDEEAMYAQYVIDESTAGRPVPEYSLRMLLERMNSNPNEFENALIVNLHGELIPFVPMRNYSDAAKSPANYPDLRIVSHPERLSYTSTDTVKVRVYPYAMVENATYPYGFVGRYYNANNYTNLLFTRSDSSINFDWAGGKPANNITNADAFSAIWRGRIRAKTTDNYTFTLRANGGGYFDFEVNGNDITLAADNNTLKIQTYAANLVQNTEYPIELGFTESFAGDASVQLTWQITGQPATEEVITFPDISTATVLFPGITINTSDITVQKFVGGSTVAYQLNTVADLVSGPDCRVAYPSGGTLLTFYNNPVLHPYSNPSGTTAGKP
ncbi:MAG: PA14 domain-containing protein [Elusimicrobia bacterium]|nr:PA14 domain-containing protein [Elusimicrobiota bacterium]